MRSPSFLTPAARSVARGYVRNCLREMDWQIGAGWPWEKRRDTRRVMRAYVAFVQAYGMAFPQEAHLLPDSFHGPRMVEHRAFVMLCNLFLTALAMWLAVCGPLAIGVWVLATRGGE